MFDLPDLGSLYGIGTPENVSYASPFDHGLGRRDQGRFAMFNAHSSISLNPRNITFGITQLLPVSMQTDDPQASITNALEMLQRHVISWHDRVSYHELGSSIHLLPDESGNTDNTEESEAIGARSADKRFVMHPHHYGYMRLHSAFSRAFGRIAEEHPDDATFKAIEIAERALKDLLPEQAYLFIPPEALILATKEAERIAEDTIKHAKHREKEQPKEAKLYGQVKQKLAHSIHAMRTRHDGRMHFFPYTQLYAPETGIATIAIIASQQQSIVNDHGRMSASARGLVI